MSARRSSWIFAIAASGFVACGGSGSGSTGGVGGAAGVGGGSQGGSGGGAVLCVPNQQLACACGQGLQGYQVCFSDGSGYGPCLCPDAGAGGAAGNAGAAGSAGSGGVSGMGGTSGAGGTGSGGAPAGGGAGGCAATSVFPCGPTTCNAPYQYCHKYNSTSYVCEESMLSCGCTVTCSCLPQLIGCPNTTCTQSGTGFVLACG